MTDSAQDFSLLKQRDGTALAYVKAAGRSPTVVFCGGFRSDMTGTKAMALDAWARRSGFGLLRFDYFAHGRTGGDFAQGTIGRWRQDALAVIAAATEGSLVLVGSSMGGWIMLSLIDELAPRLAGLVGVAAAPDFTEDLIWGRLSVEDRKELLRHGQLLRPSRYSEQPDILTLRLIEEGRHHLVMNKPMKAPCPVHLLHGMADDEVPWQLSRRVIEHIEAPEATLTLVKHGDHRLSEPEDIERLTSIVERLCRRAT